MSSEADDFIAKIHAERDTACFPPEAWLKFSLEGGVVPTQYLSSEEANRQIRCTFDLEKIHTSGKGYGLQKTYEVKRGMVMEDLEKLSCFTLEGGDGMIIESPPEGCESSDEKTSSAIATSFDWCGVYYEIDLVKWGIDPWVLDYVRPRIVVSQLTNCRYDCPASYSLRAHLMRENEEFALDYTFTPIDLLRIKQFDKEWKEGEGGKAWAKAELVFDEYAIGVRKLGIVSRGKDMRYWKGYFGPKFTNLEVEITLPNEVKFCRADQFPDPELKRECYNRERLEECGGCCHTEEQPQQNRPGVISIPLTCYRRPMRTGPQNVFHNDASKLFGVPRKPEPVTDKNTSESSEVNDNEKKQEEGESSEPRSGVFTMQLHCRPAIFPDDDLKVEEKKDV